MIEEKNQAPAEKPEKPGIKIASVIAAALAAVTAALLGSTLGMAGTVLGAGVASVVTTVGGELYLRSLQRTREAARRAKALTTLGVRRTGANRDSADDAADREKISAEEAEPSARRWKPRWPLVIGTSVLAFGLAILAITGVEGVTGRTFGGGTGTTIGKIFGGDAGPPTRDREQTPPTSESTPGETTPAPTSATTSTTPPPATTSTPPTTDSTLPPATTAQPPSTPIPTRNAPSTGPGTPG